ncbi:SRPBCC family protein [Mariniblastus fucicola]|uniref:Activator of Hsp90 ATPase homologue 1/2-like C-terminal domain-containing protein n=1 Tax=Mariniblastus fucicola TaxID=980251 RepID=A0A5B9PEV1_9BACT|nr:SRPBCC domain-containing protein [Mariniblastus fucicola]QEG21511.1 hypothetical protein MFFC18_13670 [Mariniblastus fucicola]
MMRHVILALAATLFCYESAIGQDVRVADEFEIEASVDLVWNAFTTTEGLQSWLAPLADIDFRVGGEWRANYAKDGKLGDETTIENTILCHDPQRKLSIKATGFPKGFEFENAAKETWSIFYFEKVSDTKTKITIVGLGYNDTEPSKKMRAHFKPANEYSMNRLKAALEKKAPDNEASKKQINN